MSTTIKNIKSAFDDSVKMFDQLIIIANSLADNQEAYKETIALINQYSNDTLLELAANTRDNKPPLPEMTRLFASDDKFKSLITKCLFYTTKAQAILPIFCDAATASEYKTDKQKTDTLNFFATILKQSVRRDKWDQVLILIKTIASLDAHYDYNQISLNFDPANFENVATNLSKQPLPLLHYLVFMGKDDLISLILSLNNNTNISKKTSVEGYTPLHIAIEEEADPIAKLLIEKGADVSAQDNLGRTPLHGAAEMDEFETVCLLLRHGANPHIRDNNDVTAIMLSTDKIKDLLKDAELCPQPGL